VRSDGEHLHLRCKCSPSPPVLTMTRTFKHLYPQIYDLENLWLAWRRARRGGKRKWASVGRLRVRPGAEPVRPARGAARPDLPARPLPPFHHPRAESTAHLGRALSGSRGASCLDAGHLAHLRGAHDLRQLRLPCGQGHAPRHRPCAGMEPASPLRLAVRCRPVLPGRRPRHPARPTSPPHRLPRHPLADGPHSGQRPGRAGRALRHGLFPRRRPFDRLRARPAGGLPAQGACPSAT
jgi:hypothetical protein